MGSATDPSHVSLQTLLQADTDTSESLQEQLDGFQNTSAFNRPHILQTIQFLASEHKAIGRELVRRSEVLRWDVANPMWEQVHAIDAQIEKHDIQSTRLAEFRDFNNLD